jgi:broad specificity phosphatase PhoE
VAIYLVRHGLSEGNAQGVFQGSQDYPLTGQGRKQATALGRWLAARAVKPDHAFTSPLKRARQTAEIICKELGIAEPVDVPEIAEYYAGDIEGLNAEERAAEFPEYALRKLGERGDFSDFGGESYEDMQARLGRFISHMHQHNWDDDILAVGHGGSFYQLVKLWCGWPTPRHYFTRLSNCCCFKLMLRRVNDHRVAELQWLIPLELIAPELAESPAGCQTGGK